MNQKNGLRIAVMTNTRSGKGRYLRQKYNEKFEKIIQEVNNSTDNPNNIQLYVTSDLNEIIQAGKNTKKENIDVIAIFGGDGAIQKTLTRLQTAYGVDPLPNIVLLRGGTMNNVARSFKAKGTPDQRLKEFCSNARQDNLNKFPRKTMDINGELGFMYGLAAPCNFISMYDEAGAGPINAILMILKLIFSSIIRGKTAKKLFSPAKGRFEVDGQALSWTKAFVVLAQTIPNLALGFQITFRALEVFQPGKEEKIAHGIIADITPFQLIRKIFHILFRRPFHGKKIINDLVQDIRYYPSQPCNFMLDGDIFAHPDPSQPIIMQGGPTIQFVWHKNLKES